MAAKVLEEFARQSRPEVHSSSDVEVLSAREREVLTLIARGQSNKKIADTLAVAESTVKNHLRNILEKLHLENRVQAATYALQKGILESAGRQGGTQSRRSVGGR